MTARQRTIAALHASIEAEHSPFPIVQRPVDCTDASLFPNIAEAIAFAKRKALS